MELILIDIANQYRNVVQLNGVVLQGLIELIIITGILIFKFNIADWKP